jgi:hypothetical protein
MHETMLERRNAILQIEIPPMLSESNSSGEIRDHQRHERCSPSRQNANGNAQSKSDA